MRISRLDLYGFKSFPDRTTFHFGRGVSCVVGPNGCGKSNVVDALRWCIGEQSPRSLRGSEMADVIFAGSADRRPVGFAEVQLTMTTDDEAPFPGDFAALREIQVGRRLHRSGASEYLINQGKVRRRDVVELLLDSGIGNNLYSFIEQGQVDKVITATPEERRSVIDEAAGIARYKARREEARARLDATAAQLDRASDVADEMSRRLRTLERQVVRAARFRRLRARIRLGELRLALVKVQALSGDRRALREKLRGLQGQEAAARRELARREEDLAERREEIEVVEGAVATRRDAVADLDAAIREHDATRRLHEQRVGELEAAVEVALRDVERTEGEVARAREDVAGAAAEHTEVSGQLDAARMARVEAEDQAAAAQGALEAASRALADAEEVSAAGLRRRLELEARGTALRARADDLDRRIQTLEGMLAELEGRGVAAAAAHTEAVAAAGPVEEALTSAAAAEAEASAAYEAAVAQLSAVQAALAEGVRARQLAESEHRAHVDAARRRSAAWVAALEHAGAAAAVAVEGQWRARISAEREAATRRIEAWSATELARAREAAAQTLADLDARLSAARDGRDRAEAAVEHARAERDRGEASGRVVAAALARAEARHAALTARIAALAPTLPGVPRLVELVDAPERDDLLARLGNDALLPVVRDEAGIPDLTEGELRLWFVPGEGLPASARTGWADDRAEALARYRADGLPVSAPGLRIAGDLVVLGVADAARDAAEAAALASELEGLRADQTAAEADARRAAAALTDARQARDIAHEALATCQAEVEGLRADVLASVQAEVSASTAAARTEADVELAALDEARIRAVEDTRTASSRDTAAAREEAERILSALEDADRAGPPLDPLEEQVEQARSAVAAALGLRDAARQALADARIASHRAEEAVRAATRGREGVEQERAARRDELAGQVAQQQEVSVALEGQGQDLTRLTRDSDAADAELDARRGSRDTLGAAASAARDAVAAARTTEAALQERLLAVQARSVAAAAREQDGVTAIARALSRAGETTQAVERTKRARAEAEAALETANTARAGAWDALEQERGRLKGLRDGLAEAERALRTIRERVDGLTTEGEALGSRVAEVQSELEVLRRRMDERYQVSVHGLLDRLHSRGTLVLEVDEEVARGLTLGSTTVDGVESVTLKPADLADEDAVVGLLDELEEDRAQLAGLGEVNLAALEEYSELEARHGELVTQREDLEESLRSIRAAIAKMNRLCRERFRDAFDRVSEHFQETYPRLVGGGSARLSLTDDEDILEAGVDIFVQPPGKRLQNLGLLSGGEKAMTAIALLISLFRVKPSPFCVLDEVDAPLDEANGARFNDMLREMSGRSQFLVITHNRKTMECADTLYGITMARPGVSRLVSVRL